MVHVEYDIKLFIAPYVVNLLQNSSKYCTPSIGNPYRQKRSNWTTCWRFEHFHCEIIVRCKLKCLQNKLILVSSRFGTFIEHAIVLHVDFIFHNEQSIDQDYSNTNDKSIKEEQQVQVFFDGMMSRADFR